MRRSVMVELAADLPPINPSLGRAEVTALQEKAVEKVRAGILAVLKRLMNKDPLLEVKGQRGSFPVLLVTTTDDVIEDLEHTPGVRAVHAVGTFGVASAR
jgi:hypothetical protein